MSFPRVRSPQQDYVTRLNFAVGAGAPSCTKNRRQTDDARSVSSAVATIDVVAADDRADEFLRGVIELVGGFGTTEHAEGTRALRSDLATDTFCHTIECFFPRRGTLRPVFTD